MTIEAGYTSRLGDIGKEIGLSSAKVGRMLYAARLRTDRGYPTPQALAEGLARSRWDGKNRKNEWCVQAVVAALKPLLVAAREQVLDELVADAQENDMGY